MQAGRERMESALGTLNSMSSYENFSIFVRSCGLKATDAQGLPKDGLRNSIPGQIISIRNLNRDERPQHLRDFNSARANNLKTALTLYKKLQHQHMHRFTSENPGHQLAQNYLKLAAKAKGQKQVPGSIQVDTD